MALSATIYKFTINISDLNRHYYDALTLTVAQHPSENTERMMTRVLAYCLHAQEGLAFTKGLSTPETPDIWCQTLDGQTSLWIEVGEPSPEKLKKASRASKAVWVYSFNTKSDVWWKQEQEKIAGLPVVVVQMAHEELQGLERLLQRTITLSVTLSGDSAFIASDHGECEVNWRFLQRVD